MRIKLIVFRDSPEKEANVSFTPVLEAPFPNENDEVERLKEEIQRKDRTIAELQSRLDTFNEIVKKMISELEKNFEYSRKLIDELKMARKKLIHLFI